MKAQSSTKLGSPRKPLQIGVALLLILLSAVSSQAGKIVAWGSNQFGQTNVPPWLTNVIAIAASGFNSLALKSDGTVVGWSQNDVNSVTIVPPGLTNVIAIAIGSSNSMALKADNTVTVWGRNNFGPVFVPEGLTDIVAVSAGWGESLVLRKDGTLLGWGRQPSLYVINTNVVASSSSPSFSAQSTHELALGPNGQVFASGANTYGECDVPSDLTNAVGVFAGQGYSLAIKDDGTVVGWGRITVPPDATNVVGLCDGGSYQLGLRADGTVFTWGGQLTPPPGLTNVIAVAAGFAHCLALVGDEPPQLKAAPSNLNLADSKLTLAVPTESGHIYRLERADSTFGTNWTSLNMEAGNGSIQKLTDPSATNSSGFYRVRRW